MIRWKRLTTRLFWTILLTVLSLAVFEIGQTSLNTPSSLSAGEPAELYSTETRDDLQKIFSQGIQSATRSVHLIVYTLTDTQIIRSLRRKAEEGVEVRLICNADSAGDLPRKLGRKVKLFLKKGKNQGIMHQKILLVDEQKIWIGSANMTPSSLKMHGNLVLGCHHPQMGALIKKKFDQMSLPGPVKPILPQGFLVGEQKLELWFFPDTKKGPTKLQKLMRNAKKSIRIAMFTWTREDLAQEVLAARERGVDVQIAMDRNSSEQISGKIYRFFSDAGVPVLRNNREGLLHHKCLIIDDTILINGSANWTHYAFARNDDCMIILYDLNQEQKAFLDKMWNELIQESTKERSHNAHISPHFMPSCKDGIKTARKFSEILPVPSNLTGANSEWRRFSGYRSTNLHDARTT